MLLEVHETRARVHAAAKEEGKAALKKQKTESQHVASKKKKIKAEESKQKGKGAVARECAEFCKGIGEHLSIENMRKTLQDNKQDASGSEAAIVP